jgi:serine/threonine protein kinase
MRTSAFPQFEVVFDTHGVPQEKMLCVDPLQRLTAEKALEHPWIVQNCDEGVMSCSPRTPSPQARSCNTARGSPPSQLERVLGDLGTMSLDTALLKRPTKLASVRSIHQSNAVFRGCCGMRSRAGSDAGDDLDFQQPDTPEQSERERHSVVLSTLIDASTP